MIAVNTPGGISMCAIVRASVSTTEQVARSEQHRYGQKARELWSDEHARGVRDQQTDPSDDPADRNARGSHERRRTRR